MSRSMYQAPFHRRVLPWIFIAMFLAAAPALVFYTSGYRLSPVKNSLERSGTMIVDSLPRGAAIMIDGQPTDRFTPSTFQYMALGPHTIRLDYEGFFQWQKSLEVRAEQVTFANKALLVRQAEPELALSVPAFALASDEGRRMATVIADYGTSSTLSFWSSSGLMGNAPLPSLPTERRPIVRFDDTGRSVLIDGLDGHTRAWWADARTNRAETLPPGNYSWRESTIVGGDARASFLIDPDTGALELIPLPFGTVDVYDGFSIQAASGTNGLTLKDARYDDRVFALPNGDWRFAGERDGWILLNHDARWISVQTESEGIHISETAGDIPRWLETDLGSMGLLIHGTELLSWLPGKDPELLWRQSEPIVQTAWHRTGRGVVVATSREVFLLELDTRDGNQIFTLGTFDQVYDVMVLGRILYIAAEIDGRRGVWSRVLE